MHRPEGIRDSGHGCAIRTSQSTMTKSSWKSKRKHAIHNTHARLPHARIIMRHLISLSQCISDMYVIWELPHSSLFNEALCTSAYHDYTFFLYKNKV